jgi:DNA gyrase subunit B
MLEGVELVNIIRNLLRMERILDLFERKNMERLVLKAFVREQMNRRYLENEDLARDVVERVRRRIETVYPGMLTVKFLIGQDEEESKYYIEVESRRNGINRRTRIDYELTQSPAFGELLALGEKVKSLGEPPLQFQSDGEKMLVPNFSALLNLITQQGRKKLTVQRYKGLGEMNAEQLWETTMQPENRRLLQVTIEDAVKANEIFSTLMGDEVEPRRNFIEKNALNVVNLDY